LTSQIQSPQVKESAMWRMVFIVLSTFILIVLPSLSHSYGQTGDEWLEIVYGQDIYNYFFHGDQQALSYENKSLQFKGMELYGGLFDYYTEILHHWFPKVFILDLKHFCNGVVGAVLMIFTGLFTYRLSKKWSVAVVALLFIFLSPRIFGESMNNPKDIPHACGFIIGMYGLLALLQDFPNKIWKHAIILGIGFGITFGSRPAGGLLQGCFFVFFTGLYYFLNKDFRESLKVNNNKLLKKLLLAIFCALLGGYIIGLSAWPFGFESPVSHSLESLSGMTNRDIVLRVLFEGTFHYNNKMPWYYEFKWIFISNPLIVLAGTLLFVVLIGAAKKEYGLFAVVVVLFSCLFPLLYMVYKHSSVHDTWRHVFFVYVYWVVAAALGWNLLTRFITNERLKWIPTAIAIVGLFPSVIWIFKSHPNEYVYFNELEGGVKGAFGYYDLDYYQNTNRQAAKWILNNVKPIPGRKIIVLSNMLGFDKYFANDTAWLGAAYGRYGERSHLVWDYYVDYPRYISAEQLQNGHWPPANVVKAFTVDDVPLSVVIQRKSADGVAAQQAMDKKDWPAAIQHYAAYIQTDTTDENVYINYGIALASAGQLEPAIAAVSRATQLDPSQAQFYQVLAQLYQAKGDAAHAQQAMGSAQEITQREQEAQE
jgi:tetratricopeptide (TPR) repeat protein